jgi:hypothetical protein
VDQPAIPSDAMSLICDYFIAPSDDAAAATAGWRGGPSKPTAPKGGPFRKKVSDPVQPFPTAEFPGIEPVVMLATLEEGLTGASADEVLEVNADAQVAADGDVMVFRLRRELVEALGGASESRLREVAGPWSRTEEFFGQGDERELAEGLSRLATLARTALESGHNVYCWMA